MTLLKRILKLMPQVDWERAKLWLEDWNLDNMSSIYDFETYDEEEF